MSLGIYSKAVVKANCQRYRKDADGTLSIDSTGFNGWGRDIATPFPPTNQTSKSPRTAGSAGINACPLPPDKPDKQVTLHPALANPNAPKDYALILGNPAQAPLLHSQGLLSVLVGDSSNASILD